MCRGTFFVLVAQKFIVLYNEKVRVEIIVELRKGQTEDESGYFIIRYRGIKSKSGCGSGSITQKNAGAGWD